MKCRSGDLAVIVTNRFSGNLGAFVRVKKVALVVPDLGAFWEFENASKPIMLAGYGEDRYNFVTVRETTSDNRAYLLDSDLQPIRNTPKRLTNEQLELLKQWM